MTIGNLRVFAERLFRLRGAQQALVLRLPGDEQLRSLGNDDTQPLSFYEVEVRQILRHAWCLVCGWGLHVLAETLRLC